MKNSSKLLWRLTICSEMQLNNLQNKFKNNSNCRALWPQLNPNLRPRNPLNRRTNSILHPVVVCFVVRTFFVTWHFGQNCQSVDELTSESPLTLLPTASTIRANYPKGPLCRHLCWYPCRSLAVCLILQEPQIHSPSIKGKDKPSLISICN